MPSEKHVTAVFTVSLICLGILLIIAKNSEPELKSIREIDKSFEDKKIRITGEVVKFAQREKVAFIDIKDSTGTIKGVVFDKIDLNNKDIIEISGNIEIYNGELEIIVGRIKVLSR